MSEQLARLPELLTAHLQLSLGALLLGILVSVPLGVAVSRVRWLEGPVLGTASVIQTVPSLALLAIMVPVLAALNLRSIGFLPAFIGLTLYSVLPILRNTVSGLATLDPAVLEAADGVGMTGRQRLWLVELPLALPVVIAGVRTSTVWTVGIATLSTPVGAPSLGNYIFSGLQTRNSTAVLVGCVAAAGLALALDGVVKLLSVGVQRSKRHLAIVALGLLTLLCGYAGATALRSQARVGSRPVLIGAKTFTEQYVLSEIMAQQLQRSAGLPSETVGSLGSTVAFDALRADEIDAYVDYSGTIWATIMHRGGVPASRDEVLEQVEVYLEAEHGVGLAAALGFENAYAFAMARRRAEALGVRRISDLTTLAPRLSIAGDYEFFARAEWAALQEVYDLEFARQRSMDSALMYQAVAQGTVDVITAFSTDGRIAALDLVVLEDDRRAIPPYDAVILVSSRLRREQPRAVLALQGLEGRIDARRMRALNRAVDQEGRSPAAVARAFLAELAVEVNR